MRKNPGRQIRTYSQRLGEYLDGRQRGEPPLSKLKLYRKAWKDLSVNVAPITSLGKKSPSIMLVPSSILDMGLAGGMNMLCVYFVPEQDYKYFVSLTTKIKRDAKTKYGVSLEQRKRPRNAN